MNKLRSHNNLKITFKKISRIKQISLIIPAILVISCGSKKESSSTATAELFMNKTDRTGQSVTRSLKDPTSGIEFKVLTLGQLNASDLSKSDFVGIIAPITPEDMEAKNLILGYPKSLIGQQHIFGAVLTEITDLSEDIGDLKLSSLKPIHVRSSYNILSQEKKFELTGCLFMCTENSNNEVLYTIPVISEDQNFIYLDLKTFGEYLDFAADTTTSELKNMKNSQVTSIDLSLSNLIFDVNSQYMNSDEKEINVKTRWYLKLLSGFNSQFIPRESRDEVGYFTTDRSSKSMITRFATAPNSENSLIKYYIKNVPDKYKKSFADALEDWNTRLKIQLGGNLIGYEFIDQNDPRFNLIIAGDIRFNVIEWDTKNRASYGGLGPSNANQFSGEIFSATVLIQGPEIDRIYREWWNIKTEEDKVKLATQLSARLTSNANAKINLQDNKIKIRSGRHEFYTSAYDPHLQDQKGLKAVDLFDKPQGLNFETYMYGYFRDMVSHEVGHNLGLRHNFKGNLGATDTQKLGSVSNSVMEYLKRPFRHLSRVGPYDVMAIEYGYIGKIPQHNNLFCTDEDVADAGKVYYSAECSSNDATSLPFDYFADMINKIQFVMTSPNSELAPIWKFEDVGDDLNTFMRGLMNYAISSEKTSSSWLKFSSSRYFSLATDKNPQKVVEMVLENLFCSKDLDQVVEMKSPEAKELTRKNIAELRQSFESTLHAYTAYGNWAPQFSCVKTYLPTPSDDDDDEY